MILEVDALGRRIRSQQDADGALLRVGLERRLNALPVVLVHAAVHRLEPFAAREALGGELGLQPVLRGTVLGEDDYSLIGPLTVWKEMLSQPTDQPLRLGVKLAGRPARPLLHFLKQCHLVAGWFLEEQAGGVEGIVGRFLCLVVHRVVFVDPVDLPLKDAP